MAEKVKLERLKRNSNILLAQVRSVKPGAFNLRLKCEVCNVNAAFVRISGYECERWISWFQIIHEGGACRRQTREVKRELDRMWGFRQRRA